jgi:hypothetical protein
MEKASEIIIVTLEDIYNWNDWKPYTPQKTWASINGQGIKTVYV